MSHATTNPTELTDVALLGLLDLLHETSEVAFANEHPTAGRYLHALVADLEEERRHRHRVLEGADEQFSTATGNGGQILDDEGDRG